MRRNRQQQACQQPGHFHKIDFLPLVDTPGVLLTLAAFGPMLELVHRCCPRGAEENRAAFPAKVFGLPFQLRRMTA
jgi:hypothetical protein